LAYNSAAVIILTVKVTDKNAEGEKEQTDTGETIPKDALTKLQNIRKSKYLTYNVVFECRLAWVLLSLLFFTRLFELLLLKVFPQYRLSK